MLESVEIARAQAQNVTIFENGFNGNTNDVQPLDVQTLEDGMGFTFILNEKGSITVYNAPIRGGRTPKRNADNQIIYKKDANGVDTQIPEYTQSMAQYCLVHVWAKEMVYDENLQPKKDGNGNIIYKEGAKWEPVMEGNEQSVRRFYPGAAQRRIFPVVIGTKPDPEDPNKSVDDPNTILKNLPTVTAKGNFVDLIQGSTSVTEACIMADKKCGVNTPAGQKTTPEMAKKATHVIKYSVIDRPWTRNINARTDSNAAKARRQPVGRYEFDAIG